MSQSVEVSRIRPEDIPNVWPSVSSLIHAAIRRTNLNRLQDIENEIFDGLGQLWIARDEAGILAALTTALVTTERGKVCILTALGGSQMSQWLPMLSKVEEFARAEGCHGMRIYGRKGWERALPAYHLEHVILERPL